MKTKISLKVVSFTIFLFVLAEVSYSQVTLQWYTLNGNNIEAYFENKGIFNQHPTMTNTAGFVWPKGSGKTAFFTAGLSIGAYITDSTGTPRLSETMASYKGEWGPGYIFNGIPYRPPEIKLYRVSRGDNSSNNPDYANWYLIVPFGAPYIDVNNNGEYDNGIDTPGVKNASQTIFGCLTDGFTDTHSSGEGFGGGITFPLLNSELHLTAWCYSQPSYADMQFIKFELISKNDSAWRKTYIGLVADPDLGGANDDYIGCDTARKLGFCYNSTNNDAVYGTAPPAVGFLILKGAINKNITPNVNLEMTSFNYFGNSSTSPPPCETDPYGEPYPAYLFLKGLKKDGSPFMNPMQSPPVMTKYIYTGDPETNTGWNEQQGSIQNCGGLTGTFIVPNPGGDRRYIIGMGAENFAVFPGDTQTVIMCQLIARGSSNLNSVTKLKNLSDLARNFYNTNYTIGINNISTSVPDKFSLNQNYPNPFNPITHIRYALPKNGFVRLVVYDAIGREIETLVNEKQTAGTYEATFNASQYSSGVYFYRLITEGFSETKKMILLK